MTPGAASPSAGTRPVALITGASRGIGRACAEHLARAGFDLVVCSRDASSIQEAAGQLGDLGTRVVGVPSDVGVRDELDALFRLVDAQFGRLDVVVSNTGGPAAGGFAVIADEDWLQAFEDTVVSLVRVLRRAMPRMERGGRGRVVVVGSSSARQPIPGMALSNTLRPAIAGLVKSTAQEVARAGITINLIAPGRIDTDRLQTVDAFLAAQDGRDYETHREAAEQAIPVGRYGSPGEVGALVAFLASDDAGYITGQTFLVDGGLVSALP